jgi:hypothetical protein
MSYSLPLVYVQPRMWKVMWAVGVGMMGLQWAVL